MSISNPKNRNKCPTVFIGPDRHSNVSFNLKYNEYIIIYNSELFFASNSVNKCVTHSN